MDFVCWHLYPPTKSGLIDFMSAPTWLTLKIWHHQKELKAMEADVSSSSTARLALLLEIALNAFGGNKNAIAPDFGKFLPFNIYAGTTHLKQNTVDIFWECMSQKLVPAYVSKALALNKPLEKELKSRKRSN